MFGLTYLSNEQKRLLQKWQTNLANAKDPRGKREAALAIQEIENKAKPYQECELAEADELKAQLLQQISLLYSIGKASSTETFRMHLRDVDLLIETLILKEKMVEQNKMKQPDDPPKSSESTKAPTINSTRRDKRKKQAFGHQRWVVDFDDEPNDPQTKPKVGKK